MGVRQIGGMGVFLGENSPLLKSLLSSGRVEFREGVQGTDRIGAIKGYGEMSMGKSKGSWSKIVVSLLGCCAVCVAETTQMPRYPQGVYVNIGNDIPGSGAADASQLPTILGNHAVSGLTVMMPWSDLNPNPPTSGQLPAPLNCGNLPTYSASDPYDWSIPDAIFCGASSSSPPKTVQFILTPGFYAPQWVLNQVNTNSCNGQFVFLPQPYYIPSSPAPPEPPNPTPTCHLAYFPNVEGLGTVIIDRVGQTLYSPLPMPWDATYKSAWQTFLLALNARYGQNPAFVAIAVAGPTAASTEILLPNGTIENQRWSTILQNQFPSQYWNTNQAFIQEWQNAIDMFGQIFSDVTLVVTICCGPNPGLPTFSGPYTLPAGGSDYCVGSPTMCCGGEYSITSYFMEPGVGGPNAKAVQFSGQTATPVTPVGTPAIKLMTASTAQSTRILGGLDFLGGLPSTSDALSTIQNFCPDATATPDAACSFHQSFYNVLADFFGRHPRLHSCSPPLRRRCYLCFPPSRWGNPK